MSRERIGMLIFRIIMITILALGFWWLGAKAMGQPAWTPTDMNSVPFTFDTDQLSDPNGANLAGWVELDPNTIWVRDWYVWCDVDTIFAYAVSHGTYSRTATIVDPNGKRATYRVTYTTPTTPGVIYFRTTFTLPSWPGLSLPRDYLINVRQKPPAMQHWTMIPFWLPHGPAYIAGRSDAGKIWQKSIKAASPYAGGKYPTERQKNDGLFMAWVMGRITKP